MKIGAKTSRPNDVTLARGPFVTTVRRGGVVIRRSSWWCPPFVGAFMLRGMWRTSVLFRRWIPVPTTHLVTGRRGDLAVVQRFVAGAVPLRELPDERLRQSGVALALRAVLEGVERCYEQTGWMPDIGGRVYVPGELYHIRQTENLVLGVDGRWWLVDVGATAMFHHRTWPTGRLHTRLLLRAVRKFIVDLEWMTSSGARCDACTEIARSAHAAV